MAIEPRNRESVELRNARLNKRQAIAMMMTNIKP